jgi:hypothetical protein
VGTREEQTDSQLLKRFVSQQDETAFAALPNARTWFRRSFKPLSG